MGIIVVLISVFTIMHHLVFSPISLFMVGVCVIMFFIQVNSSSV